jgi:hypothetical protein
MSYIKAEHQRLSVQRKSKFHQPKNVNTEGIWKPYKSNIWMVDLAQNRSSENRTIRANTGQICPVFKWSASLDGFINKTVIKTIFLYNKML